MRSSVAAAVVAVLAATAANASIPAHYEHQGTL